MTFEASPESVPGKVLPKDESAKEVKQAPGASWKADETHHLPKNRLSIVFLALTLTVFLTIVATALPTIVSQLGGGREYSWVGRSVCFYSHVLLRN
ncbi:hypothetical protein GGX14DRAFT_436049 [Mycena pura]|uniref:Uncharacterized protein n=1 Tax=Mycena pura TaxID=153505 RepID=A0AAD6VPW6_9AGAR|nr:hypothetical protein GGX14DRAFT_436049 [Mycena pura]